MPDKWKLTIVVWCLPPSLEKNQKKLRRIHKAITRELYKIPQLKICSENDFMTLFPKDLMEYGSGEEILVDIRANETNMPEYLGRVRIKNGLSRAIRRFFPGSTVECRFFQTIWLP